jgi:hypothetical protein
MILYGLHCLQLHFHGQTGPQLDVAHSPLYFSPSYLRLESTAQRVHLLTAAAAALPSSPTAASTVSL